jgi:uncharacterized protein YqhQ
MPNNQDLEDKQNLFSGRRQRLLRRSLWGCNAQPVKQRGCWSSRDASLLWSESRMEQPRNEYNIVYHYYLSFLLLYILSFVLYFYSFFIYYSFIYTLLLFIYNLLLYLIYIIIFLYFIYLFFIWVIYNDNKFTRKFWIGN